MRILMVSEDVPFPSMGGLAKHALTLARALVRAGHQVDFMGNRLHPITVAGDEGRFGGRFFAELDGDTAGWKEVPLGMFMPPRRSWIARRFARQIMRRAAAYDVIHYHGHLPNLALHIPQDINFIQTRHDQGSECLANIRFYRGQVCTTTDPVRCAACKTTTPNRLQETVSAIAVRRYREEVAQAFRRHKTVFVSDLLQRNFSRVMGVEQWGVTLHNFVDLDLLAQVRAATVMRDAIHNAATAGMTYGGRRSAGAGLSVCTEPIVPVTSVTSATPVTATTPVAPASAESLNLFIAAKLYPAKGVGALLEELVPRMPPQLQIRIAGDGHEEQHLRARWDSKQVKFIGWCTQLQTLEMTARANAVIVPSLVEEACATTVLEALALGKTVFALARGGTPELTAYAAGAHQLRLFDDLRALVDALLAFTPCADVPPPREGGVEQAVQELLTLYRLPPGPLDGRETMQGTRTGELNDQLKDQLNGQLDGQLDGQLNDQRSGKLTGKRGGNQGNRV